MRFLLLEQEFIMFNTKSFYSWKIVLAAGAFFIAVTWIGSYKNSKQYV